ncbi:membrane-associated protein, putative [Bodo saltans]|uniref:Membrane-associated protein, putative n=1 Tax=Bodo saltans TaxID=75058 RepID=A0A0S4JTF0_BODSA|nr:membrane-associated protein, putative [Bodo saltans]|eukprot:CUG93497.1 membrane-associated protein, putative [Bodo saltans]
MPSVISNYFCGVDCNFEPPSHFRSSSSTAFEGRVWCENGTTEGCVGDGVRMALVAVIVVVVVVVTDLFKRQILVPFSEKIVCEIAVSR